MKVPATKRLFGRNPFTGQEQWFEAKSATVRVKVRALKKVKDAALNGLGWRGATPRGGYGLLCYFDPQHGAVEVCGCIASSGTCRAACFLTLSGMGNRRAVSVEPRSTAWEVRACARCVGEREP